MGRILLMDDNPQLLKLLSQALEGEGHACVCASDGAAGIRALDEGGFDLVVTDLVMPEQEGLETIQQIRRRGLRLPILAISGSLEDLGTDFLPIARRFGADRTLQKPFELKEFLEAVRGLL